MTEPEPVPDRHDSDDALLAAHARGHLLDPTDAAVFLDPTSLARDEHGVLDAQAIDDAIQDLITTRPYLAPGPAPAADKWPEGDQGPLGESVDLTISRSKLRDPRYYAANRDAVHRAMREGRIVDDL